MRRRLFGLSGAILGLLVGPASALAAAPPAVVGAVSNNTSLSGATSVAVAGNVAYTTAYWPGQLTAVNISNPSSPMVIGSTPATTSLHNGTDVTIAGRYAYVTSKNRNASISSNDDGTGNSLTIVDISNPSAPSVVGAVTNADPAHPHELFGAYGVTVSGGFAYVAYQGVLSGQPKSPETTTGGFTVIDVSNPSAPAIVGNLTNTSTGQYANDLQHATSVAISGHYAYVTAFYGARVTVIDISNPAAPSIVTSLNDSTHLKSPNNIAIAGHYAYVADQNGATGVQFSILDISNPTAPVVAGSLSDALLNNAYTLRVRGNFAYLVASNSSVMAAIDVTDPAHPRLASYIQDAGHLFTVLGIEVDSTGAYAITASPRASGEPGQTYPTFVFTTGTASVIQLDPVPISVSIAPSSEPPNPTSQTSANFSFSVADQIATVACNLDGGPFGPCTTPTSDQVGPLGPGSHTFTVQATDAAGRTASDTYTWTVGTSAGSAPKNTAPPTISGAAIQHATLTGGLGSWGGNPTPSLAAQWLRCNAAGAACRAIAGARAARYTLTASDVGSRIRLSVRATNVSGSASAQSAATPVVKRGTTGALTGVARRRPTLRLTVSAVAPSTRVTNLAIAVPRGLRFATSRRQAAAGIHLADGAGKRLGFTAALRNGTLVLTLKRAVATARVTIGPQAVSVSDGLAASVGNKRAHKVTVTVTFTDTTGQRLRSALGLLAH